jgi:hypothetical protein
VILLPCLTVRRLCGASGSVSEPGVFRTDCRWGQERWKGAAKIKIFHYMNLLKIPTCCNVRVETEASDVVFVEGTTKAISENASAQ